MAKDPVLSKVWLFYRGRGRRRRKPAIIALMVLGTLLLVAILFVAIAAVISGHPTPNLGDDPMEVPAGN